MAVVFKNNAKTTLASSLSSSATSVSVADGSVFPSLGSGEVFFCTLDDGNNNEIVKVTAVSSNTLTVVRAQESTTARSFSSGDAAELRLTAGILSLFSQTGVAITDEIEAYLDANGLTFPDSVKAQFGASNDLQIFHDGNNSIIKDAGNGNLELHATNLVFKNSDSSLQYASFISGGAAELRFNGSPKLATTSSGVSVTGAVNATNTYELNGTTVIDTSRNLTNIGTAQISGTTNIGSTATGLQFIIHATDEYRINGADSAGNGFNSIHLRADGTDGLFIQKDTNKVGIGTSSPDVKLRVDHDDNTVAFKVTGGGGGANIAEFVRDVGTSGVSVSVNGSSARPQIKFVKPSNTFAIGVNSSSFEIADNDVLGTNTRLSIDSSGHLDLKTGNYKVNGTTVIDTSRNLHNIGTISSGAITTTNVMASSPYHHHFDVSGTNVVGGGAGIVLQTSASAGTTGLYGAKIQAVRTASNDGSADLEFYTSDADTASGAHQLALTLDENQNATFAGNIAVTGNATISGDLTVSGTTTTINTTNLDVADKNITLNFGAGDTSSNANGAGITIQDAVNSTTDATILWDSTNDEFDFSHPIKVAGSLGVTNIVTNKVVKFNGTILDDSNITDTGSAITLGSNTTVSGGLDVGTVTSTGNLVLNQDSGTIFIGADLDMRILHDGSNGTFRNDTGSLTVDSAAQIVLDGADEGTTRFLNSGTQYGQIFNQSNDFKFKSLISDGDIIFQGNDGGSGITALTLDMSNAGAATFNSTISGGQINATTSSDATAAIIATNTGGVSSIIQRWVGDSDALDVRCIDTGDYQISNSQQTNGIDFYDGTGGLAFRYNNAVVAQINSTGGFNLATGAYKVNGTTVIDSSRNLTNIGTISSGALTSSGGLTVNGDITLTENDKIKTSESSGGSHLLLRSDNLGVTGNSLSLISLNDILIGAKSNQSGTGNIYFGYNAQNKASGSGWVDTLTILESGNVGIGNTNPARKFEVKAGSEGYVARFKGSSSAVDIFAGNTGSFTGGLITTPTNIPLGLSTNTGAGVLIIDTNNRVGIGTQSPSDTLSVNGHISLGTGSNKIYNGSSADSAGMFFAGSTLNLSGFADIVLRASTTNIAVQTERLRVKADTGRVGIGTQSPGAMLHVDAPGVALGSQPLNIAIFDGTGTDGTSQIKVTHNTASTAAALAAGIEFQVGDGTSGSNTKSSYIRQRGAGQLSFDYIADKNHLFFVDHHDNDLTGTNYQDRGTVALDIQESGDVKAFYNFNAVNGIQINGTEVISGGRNLRNIGTISGTGISTAANLVDLFNNQNGVNELRLDNNRQDLSNVPVSKVSGRNSVEVANMTFYRGGGGNSGFIRFQNKPTNASSLTDVFQIGDGGTVGYGVNIMAGGLRINNAEVITSSRNLTNIGTISSGAITSTGTSTFGTVTSASYKVGASTVIDNSRNLINIGTITSNKITATGGDDQSSTGVLELATSGGTNLKLGGNTNYSWIQSHASKPLYINELGNNVILNNAGGRVGIGIGSPVQPLHIHTTSNSQMQFTDNTSGSNTSDGFRVGWNGTVGQLYLFESADLRFATSNAERMRIKADGKVGINDTTPSQTLDINGNLGIGGTEVITSSRNLTNIGTISSGAITTTGFFNIHAAHTVYAGMVTTTSTATTSYNVIRFTQGSGSGAPTGLIGTAGSAVGNTAFRSGMNIGTQTSGSLNFIINDGLAARIDTSGNFQMGTTTVIDSSRNLTNIGTATIANLVGTGRYHEIGNNTGAVSNDGTWHARLNIAGTSHARLDLFEDANDSKLRLYVHAGQHARIDTTSNHEIHFGTNGSVRYKAVAAGLDINSGHRLTHNGTTVLDASRNLTNIGTISSGAITSSGSVTAGTSLELPSNGMIDWQNGDARIIEGLTNNYSLSFQTYDGSNLTTALRLDGNNAATFAGTISSGAITSTGNSIFTGSGSSGSSNAFLIRRGSDNSGAFRVQNDGVVITEANYLYAASSGISLYVQNGLVARGDILNDTGGQPVKVADNFNVTGVYQANGTTIVDASRNLTNIGTISSGAITSSGRIMTTQEGANSLKSRFLMGKDSGNTNDGALFINYGTSHGVFIGAGGGSSSLTVAGDVTAFSDERLKDNIQTLDGKKALQMRGVSYIRDGKEGSGVIAQEIEKIAPELVLTADDEQGTKSVAYGNLVGYLIEAIKDQQDQIEYMKSEIKVLKEANNGNK